MQALARRSERRSRGRFLAEGPQCVDEGVQHRPDCVDEVFVDPQAPGRARELAEQARQLGIPVTEADSRVVAALSDTSSPQGVVAVCRTLDIPLADLLQRQPRVLLVLAQLRDPGNVGTAIRAADAAGADGVVVSDASADVYAPKVVRASAGSVFHVPLVIGVPTGLLAPSLGAAGIRLLAADPRGDTLLPEADLGERHAWVVGNEAWGLPEGLRGACDQAVAIPAYGRAESLNVAMATTLCLFASAERRPGDRRGGLS